MKRYRGERLLSWSGMLVVGFLGVWVVSCGGTGGGPISPPGTGGIASCEENCQQRFSLCIDCDRSRPGCPLPAQCASGRRGCLEACNCRPTTCAALGLQCGVATDGCGHTLDCGGCPGGSTCFTGRCVTTEQCTLQCNEQFASCLDCDRSRPGCPLPAQCAAGHQACLAACN